MTLTLRYSVAVVIAALVLATGRGALAQSAHPLFTTAEPYQLPLAVRAGSTNSATNCVTKTVDSEVSTGISEFCAYRLSWDNLPPPRNVDPHDHWVLVRSSTNVTWKPAYLAAFSPEERLVIEAILRTEQSAPYIYSITLSSLVNSLTTGEDVPALTPRLYETPVYILAEGVVAGTVRLGPLVVVDDEAVYKEVLLHHMRMFDSVQDITDVGQRCYIANVLNLVPTAEAAAAFLECPY